MMKDKLRQLLFDIADYSGYETVTDDVTGLHTGYAGLSLFYFQTWLYSKNYVHYEKALYFFELSFNRMDPSNINFSFGSSGVMWLLNYYKNKKAFRFDFETVLAQYDEVLYHRLDDLSHNLDPMHGALGLTNYLFTRNTPAAAAALANILELTDFYKITVPGGITWKYPDVDLVLGEVECENMGYAHGNLAHIYFLAKLINKGIQVEKAQDLYQQAITYFLSRRDPNQPFHFPTLICNGEIRRQERVSYCYGDLGVACGLAAVGNLMQDTSLLGIARETAANIAGFTREKINMGNDIGLCHGAAGNAYLFYKLYRQLGLRCLKDRSDAYFQKLLEMQVNGTGIAGYLSYKFDKTLDRFIQIPDATLLNGTSGMGLCILAFLNQRSKNAWDQLLLLS